MQFIKNLFGGNKAQFSAATLEAPSPRINGAQYEAVDTGDGFVTIKNVLFFAEVPKGEKNAPEDVKAERMRQMVSAALNKYEKEKFAAPAHKGHHKMVALEDPEFLGFMLPRNVAKTTLDGREQDAIFGDLKLKASAFERVKKGELPYLSPEVDWETWQFSSMALLDSMPPHFKGPLITVGKITEDPTAKFTVGSTTSKGLFMHLPTGEKNENTAKEDKKLREGEPTESKKNEHMSHADPDGDGDVHDDAKMCAHCVKKMAAYEMSVAHMDKAMADVHYKMGLPYKGAQMMADHTFKKPESSAPKEDNEKGKTVEKIKFEDDPAAVAKFAAQEARTKALEDKLAAKDLEEAKKVRIAAAFEDLKEYPLTQAGKDGIAKFADDPEKLKTFVDALKAQTPKNSPNTVSEFEKIGKPAAPAVNGADPDLAEFQLKRPADMPAILRYAQFHETWKASKASVGASDEIKSNRKLFIETMMRIDPTGKYLDNHKNEGVR